VATPFVLHVGDLHERRNLPLAVAAVLEARSRVPELSSLSLVLAGVDRGVGDRVRDLAVAAGVADAVVILGPVEEDVLRALYDQALALVYPSLYEGFGLPMLEAMACGTPVLASRAASMPEVAGDAGVLLDPHRSAEWTDALAALGSDTMLRNDLRGRGLARAAQFTWERTARQTLDVYRAAAEAGSREPRA
jgi:glycosyltransferase involved in cell wall biosynthesis